VGNVMKNVFLDTNIYLNFYHFTDEDLEELKKLSVIVNKEVRLYMTDQVYNEFKRNRENKIGAALRDFGKQIIPNQFPQICKGYPEYKELRESVKNFVIAKQKITQKLRSDVEENQLAADQIIESLFSVATFIKTDEETIRMAAQRVSLGNPPGKANSYGDAINWELLLRTVPNEENFYFVTDDKDYYSIINEDKLSEYLGWEWEQRKKSKIFCFHRLSEYLNSEFPEIKLASDFEKKLAIDDFVSSGSFSSTKATIKRLSKYTEFSDAELRKIIDASIENNQIYWIRSDYPVKSFLTRVIEGKEGILDPQVYERFKDIYLGEQEEGQEEEQEDFEFDDE
jgi:hypothetical protein